MILFNKNIFLYYIMQENISESLKYYDNSLKKYKKYYKNNKKLILLVDFINDVPTFELKNDNKIFMKGDYNLLGVYIDKNGKKYFRWAWDYLYSTNILPIPTKDIQNANHYEYGDPLPNKNNDIVLNINNTYFIKKIINYIFDLKININNFKETFYYVDIKNIFLHHIVEIENPLQMELILAMTLLITKSDLIWKVDDKKDNFIIYYLLRNVKEL
jgi:hypothetical protein